MNDEQREEIVEQAIGAPRKDWVREERVSAKIAHLALALAIPGDSTVVRREDLRGIEWREDEAGKYCAICGWWKHEDHDPDCWLGKALEGDG